MTPSGVGGPCTPKRNFSLLQTCKLVRNGAESGVSRLGSPSRGTGASHQRETLVFLMRLVVTRMLLAVAATSALTLPGPLVKDAVKPPKPGLPKKTRHARRPRPVMTICDGDDLAHAEPAAEPERSQFAAVQTAAASADDSNRFQELLDAPLVDPYEGTGWFDELARTDYHLAEAVWAGLYCSFCVSLGMSMVRPLRSHSLCPPARLPPTWRASDGRCAHTLPSRTSRRRCEGSSSRVRPALTDGRSIKLGILSRKGVYAFAWARVLRGVLGGCAFS